MPLEIIAQKHMISGCEMETAPEWALARAHEKLQIGVGKALISYLWNRTAPVMVQLSHREERPLDSDYWNQKILSLKAAVHEVYVENMCTQVHIAQLNQVVHVPHFQYFPKDWVCVRCGCIVDGLHSPRICDRCGGPRPTRKKAILAMGGIV